MKMRDREINDLLRDDALLRMHELGLQKECQFDCCRHTPSFPVVRKMKP